VLPSRVVSRPYPCQTRLENIARDKYSNLFFPGKYYARLERIARDKHSNLFFPCKYYSRLERIAWDKTHELICPFQILCQAGKDCLGQNTLGYFSLANIIRGWKGLPGTKHTSLFVPCKYYTRLERIAWDKTH
jgi:hypothetical protein